MSATRSSDGAEDAGQVFHELPLTVAIDRRILAMHGGISPEIKSWEDLDALEVLSSPGKLTEAKDSEGMRRVAGRRPDVGGSGEGHVRLLAQQRESPGREKERVRSTAAHLGSSGPTWCSTYAATCSSTS